MLEKNRYFAALSGVLVASVTALTFLAVSGAGAQTVQRIAAIVNDDVISSYDLEARMRLVIFSTRLPNTPEVRRRIQGQVLRSLIDEKLQSQEAERRNISVSRREIERAREAVEQRNNIPAGQLSNFLGRNGVPEDSMMAQLRANLAWSKLLARRLRPRITIGEDEIDEVLNGIKSRQGQTEYRLSEIVLAVDSPDEEERVRATATRIADQIIKGANFSAIAREFSESATAAVGGDLGWIHEAELDTDLREVVPKMRRGGITDPIKTVSGYRILMLQDIRKIAQAEGKPEIVDLRQIFLPVGSNPSDSAFETQIGLARTLQSTAQNCEDFEALAKEVQSPRPADLGKLEVANMAPAIQTVVRALDEGKVSDPVKLPDGVMVLMVCDRTGGAGAIELPPRDEIADQLLRERLSLMARRYLRDLRLSAVVDVRI